MDRASLPKTNWPAPATRVNSSRRPQRNCLPEIDAHIECGPGRPASYQERTMDIRTSYLPAFGRLLIAAIFIISGFGKIAAPAMTQGYISSVGLPAPLFAYLLAIVVEIGGGILLVVAF